MSTAVLLFALLMAADERRAAPSLDANSDATLERTMAVARDQLPEAQRAKFDQAIKLLMADFIGKQGDGATQEQVAAAWRAALHGKTANEVIFAAEAIVRTKIADHAKKQATAISRALPSAVAVRGESLACESLLSTSIKLERVDESEFFAITETSLLKPEAEIHALSDRRQLRAAATTGTDTLAIEISDTTLKVMTRASVEMGQASPAAFTITRNDGAILAAVGLDDAPLGVIFDSLLLNKENGLAVWTKARSASILGGQPTTQSLYLRCR